MNIYSCGGVKVIYCIIEVSTIYGFHSTQTVNIYWILNFPRFFSNSVFRFCLHTLCLAQKPGLNRCICSNSDMLSFFCGDQFIFGTVADFITISCVRHRFYLCWCNSVRVHKNILFNKMIWKILYFFHIQKVPNIKLTHYSM